jgi:branched-chain amino acid transport system ATP-binding protein
MHAETVSTDRKAAALAAFKELAREPGVPKPDPILVVDNVVRRFGGLTAVEVDHVEVQRGSITALIGPNGAGKTTFFNCVLGVLRPDSGTVRLHGEDVSRLRVHQRVSRGIGRTFQRIELFAELTVRQHLLIAERTHRGDGRLWKDLIGRGKARAEEIERCDEVLSLLGLGDVAEEPIEHLSLGKGRLVEVGRALMTQPSVLLLDEPSSGLDRKETADLARTLLEVQSEQGFAILLVEHDVEFVSGFTERVYVLDFGCMIAHGPTAEVLQSDIVRQAYLGDVGTAT